MHAALKCGPFQPNSERVSAKLTRNSDSISCLHAIEHFGLGRYGDPVDVLGHVKALDNIRKALTPGKPAAHDILPDALDDLNSQAAHDLIHLRNPVTSELVARPHPIIDPISC